jgi:hypothetical protein
MDSKEALPPRMRAASSMDSEFSRRRAFPCGFTGQREINAHFIPLCNSKFFMAGVRSPQREDICHNFLPQFFKELRSDFLPEKSVW